MSRRFLAGWILALSASCLTLPAQSDKSPNAAPDPVNKPSVFFGKKDPRQPDTRSVRGAVKDEDENAIEGALVQLKDTKTDKSRTFITKADGTYRFDNLDEYVDYELRASQKDKSAPMRRVTRLFSRKQAILNFTLKPGGEEQDASEAK